MLVKRRLIGSYIFILSIFLVGCWDNMDINERSFASAVGLDKGEDGKIELSLQIIRPNIIRANLEGGTSESAMWVSTTTGETVFDAVREQLKTIHRKPFYTHLRVIIIGEELAREGIRDVIDFFMRDHEVRVTPKIIISKGAKAKEIIGAASKLESIPALHLEGILENNVSEAKTRDVNLIDVIHELTSAHGGGVIASIIPPENREEMMIKNLKMEGGAVFQQEKLVGYIESIQIRGYLFLKGEVDGGIINIENPKEKGKKLALEIKSAKGKIDVDFDGEDIVLKSEVKVLCGMGEQQGSGDLANDKSLSEMENGLRKEIEHNIRETMKLAQKHFKNDFIGFGNVVSMKYPQYWDEVKDNWDEEFSKLPLEMKIDTEIDRTGILAQPIELQ